MDLGGLRARCKNKWAKIHRIDLETLRSVPYDTPVTLPVVISIFVRCDIPSFLGVCALGFFSACDISHLLVYFGFEERNQMVAPA